MNEVKLNDSVKMTVRRKPSARSRGQSTDKSGATKTMEERIVQRDMF